MSRAERRHHKDRMKAKARRIAREVWGYKDEDGGQVVANMERCADHLMSCSCSMCCNVRRNGWTKGGGLTHAEQFAEADLREPFDLESFPATGDSISHMTQNFWAGMRENEANAREANIGGEGE